MSHTHLTMSERAKIEAYLELGFSMREIARRIGRDVSTISRELKRHRQEGRYDSDSAQASYQSNKSRCGAKGKFTEKTAGVIRSHLEKTWSPEQIAERLFKGRLSFKTVYRWIYLGLLDISLQALRQKGKRRQPRETRGRFNVGTPISKRPKEIRKRETFGHWELDTVVSSRGKSKGCAATFIERMTRMYIAILMPDRTAASMEAAVRKLHSALPKGSFKTATTDRGKEFSCYKKLEADLGIDVYFADPYSSWQRGSNENANGLLREFFPKRTDFSGMDDNAVMDAIRLINNRPRKCLNWKTANEAFMDEVLRLI